MAKVQKGAADAAAKLIAKYGKAAVSSAVRNFKPVAKVKVTGSGATGNGRFPTSNVKPKRLLQAGLQIKELLLKDIQEKNLLLNVIGPSTKKNK